MPQFWKAAFIYCIYISSSKWYEQPFQYSIIVPLIEIYFNYQFWTSVDSMKGHNEVIGVFHCMHESIYLNFDRSADDHRLFQELFVELRRVVVHVKNSDEDLRQAVLPLWIFCFDVKIVFGPDLGVQAGPGLRGDEARWRVDVKPAASEHFRHDSHSCQHRCLWCIRHSLNKAFLYADKVVNLKWHIQVYYYLLLKCFQFFIKQVS